MSVQTKDVGYIGDNYNTRKQIHGESLEGFRFIRVFDANNIGLRLAHKTSANQSAIGHWNLIRSRLFLPRCDCLHLWNQVTTSRTPWVTSTSIGLPFLSHRDDTTHRHETKAVALLAHDACKRVICTSEYAFEKQCLKLSRYPAYEARVLEKVELIPPSQPRLIESINEKYKFLEDELIFTFVGHEFWRKGGDEVVRVFSEVIAEGAPVRLNVVSRLTLDGRFGTHEEQRSEVTHRMSQCPGISFTQSLPHDQVIALLAKSHVALLPSYIETYGYSVLEAQACGCPVITTDTNAFGEINPTDCGWQVAVADSTDITEADSRTASRTGLIRTRERLLHGLRQTIGLIVQHPEHVRNKAVLAFSRIASHHCPEERAQRISQVYEDSISSR